MPDVHGLLIVDKPRGITSHDVVARVRRLLKTRKVGHAGTLDPAAEGVLVIAVGRATKLLAYLTDSPKRYLAHMVLGVESETGDIEGPTRLRNQLDAVPHLRDVDEAVAQFIGELTQTPPAHSAVKVNGQPLYKRARRGDDVDVPSRTVSIETLAIFDYAYPDLVLDVECSAGTYVRSLARDIGDALGTGAYLHYLLRVRSGSFDVAGAWPLARLEQDLSPETFASIALHPSSIPVKSMALLLDSDGARAWYDGRPVGADNSESDRATAHGFKPDGTWLGAGERRTDQPAYQPRIVVHD